MGASETAGSWEAATADRTAAVFRHSRLGRGSSGHDDYFASPPNHNHHPYNHNLQDARDLVPPLTDRGRSHIDPPQ